MRWSLLLIAAVLLCGSPAYASSKVFSQYLTSWSGAGINIGQNNQPYDFSNGGLVQTDLSLFSRSGIKYIRTAYMTFTASTSVIASESLATTSMAYGGFTVEWGPTVGSGVSSTTMDQYMGNYNRYFETFCQTNNVPQCSVGNEEEHHVDGTTITAGQMRTDLESLACEVKADGYTGKVVYDAEIGDVAAWAAIDHHCIDILYFHPYGGSCTSDSDFKGYISTILANFSVASTGISEWNTASGINQCSSEVQWGNIVARYYEDIRNSGLTVADFFGARDGTNDGATDKWAVQVSTGGVRPTVANALNILSQ